MRVNCPNCAQKCLIDVVALCDGSIEVACANCGTHFRASLVCELIEAQVQPAAQFGLAPPPVSQAEEMRAAAELRAASEDEWDDVLALDEPREHGAASATANATCVALDLEDAGAALGLADARAHRAEDRYRLGARLLNLSPLRLLLAGAAFVVVVALCDLLLTSSAPTPDSTALAARRNQATNRSVVAHKDEPARDAQTSSTEESEKPASASDLSAESTSVVASKPAAVSDVTHTSEPIAASQSVAASIPAANAAQSDTLAVSDSQSQSVTKLTIQLASYRSEDEAQKLAQRLQSAGFEARVAAEQNSKRPWYCVQTRTFDTREEAEHCLADLRAKGFGTSYTVREIQ